MRVVKPKMVWIHQRPGLLDVLAEGFAKGTVQKMRGGVVGPSGFPDFGLVPGPHLLSGFQAAF